MAKWTDNIYSSTGGSLGGHWKNDDKNYYVSQNVKPFIEQAKKDREMQDYYGKNNKWRKAFTIPDVIAIEILNKYGLDIHSRDFNSNPASKARLKRIMSTDYPHLVVNT